MIDVLTAAELALTEIRAHNLHADTLLVEPGQQGNIGKWNPATGDNTRPCLTEVKLACDITPFLAWCDHLQAEQVRVWRGDYAVHFHLDIDHGGLCWKVQTSVRRPESGPCLPGIKPEWKRTKSNRPTKDAWITVEELRTTLAALGVAAVAA